MNAQNARRRLAEVEAAFAAMVAAQAATVAADSVPLFLSSASVALHASEGRFRALVDNSSNVIGMFEPHGPVQYVSPSVARLLGWAPQECLGRQATDFVHPEDRPAFEMLLARALSAPQNPSKTDIRAIDSKGKTKYLQVALSNQLANPALRAIVSEASEALDHVLAEERYRLFLDLVPDATVIVDSDRRIAFANSEAIRVFGYSQKELIGRPVSTLFPKDDDRGPAALRLGQSGLPLPRYTGTALRLTCRRNGGNEFPAEIAVSSALLGSATSLTATIRDVSQLVQIETALSETGARLAITLDSIGDAVIATSPNGAVTQMNPVAERLTGWLAAEALERPIDEVFPIVSENRRRLLSTPVRLLMRGTAAIPPHARLVGRHGVERIIAQSANPIFTSSGNAVGLLLTFRDVTAQKEMKEQIRVSDRMISMGTLAAGVAHEINNPLTALIGNLDLLTEELAASPRPRAKRKTNKRNSPTPSAGPLPRTTLQHAHEAADRLRLIVQDIKMYSRAPEGVNVELDVETLLESSFRMARNEMRHRARLVKRFRATPSVRADEGRLGQVFVNLLVNAAQAIPEGRMEKNEIRVATGTEAPAWVFVEISDTGVGIAPEVLPRIFDPFFTTKPVGVGTGLGLAICHRIISEIGGTITVQSRMGAGTTFRVCLPVYREEPHESKPERKREATGGRRGRVLVIDDDPLVRSAMERALDSTHEVTSVEAAGDALGLMTTGPGFDVIFCDVMMPQMTGVDFYDELTRRGAGEQTRIVFVTGGALSAKAARFIERTKNIVLQKPYDTDRLRSLAAQFVATGPSRAWAPKREVS
jgi:PAS domain S-box-containing protein